MQPTFHLVVRLCLRAATASPLWGINIGIYVQFYLCPIVFCLQKRNTINTKEVRGVFHTWLALDYLFELCMESHDSVGCSSGWLVFCFRFYFLILRHCVLYQLLTHHFEGGGNVALLFVSFFIIFLL